MVAAVARGPGQRYCCVTVTKQPLVSTCGWCGRVLAKSGGPGRPRRYCRRSHRQRAYEARRLAVRMGLEGGEALVDADQLRSQRDLLWILESALEDVEHDVDEAGNDLEEFRRAFRHLYEAASQLRGRAIEPKAVLVVPDWGGG